MKLKKAMTVLVLALALVGALTLVANAASGLQTIQAYLDSTITITMDGEPQVLLDAGGNRVYPISYNGTTYLPIRAVAGLVGLDVDWDQATRTVLLGKQPNGVDLIDTYSIYDIKKVGDQSSAGQVKTEDEKTENIAGVTQSHWIYLFSNWYGEVSASFNLQGKHDTLTFSYYSTEDATLKITGDDGSLLGEYTITGGAVPKTVTFPLFKTYELKFEVKSPDGKTSPTVKIFDAYLDAE